MLNMTLVLKELLTYYHKIPVAIELQTWEMYCARIRVPSEADFMLTNVMIKWFSWSCCPWPRLCGIVGVNNLWLALVPKTGHVHSRELFINWTVDGTTKGTRSRYQLVQCRVLSRRTKNPNEMIGWRRYELTNLTQINIIVSKKCSIMFMIIFVDSGFVVNLSYDF